MRAEYYIEDELVGIRLWHPSGLPANEYAFQNGNKHGWQYFWNTKGNLISAQPYERGLQHGTAYQWANEGRLLGTYTMEQGSGFDLWWSEDEDGNTSLAEAYNFVSGQLHGYEWQFSNGQLRAEKHWYQDQLHGIERLWDQKGKLARGFSRYWLHGERVGKPLYLHAIAQDNTLPSLLPEADNPDRTFPREIAEALNL
ncbi:toxin-antitoxin system YwqK family antitoxin [Armatimonas rosea]|uniref:Antitoxin component YwqK of YwqJK toxin-antitoxin module n=1 Tax=Armatimonas rosea TaxID=685828 RepID=A0A7W9SQQ2_ARMRO|nr:hypothetical protein [Armatimonas rosea]MBB6050695.1 antitoxin component YwqK of YwqJK toxin-antitoxin module [Armatimonas rosea]